ncbi:hypothetical protein GALMADRAFT_258624, partial [Galerina marginata CBS 339.88]
LLLHVLLKLVVLLLKLVLFPPPQAPPPHAPQARLLLKLVSSPSPCSSCSHQARPPPPRPPPPRPPSAASPRHCTHDHGFVAHDELEELGASGTGSKLLTSDFPRATGEGAGGVDKRTPLIKLIKTCRLKSFR